MREYQIEAINPHKNDEKATIRLKNTILGTYFYTDVVLDHKNADNQEDYFGYVFAPGPGKKIQTTEGSRAMIRAGHVGIGFSEDEVMLAAGEPDKVDYGQNGQYTWTYNRSNNKLLFVHFDGTGSVTKTTVGDAPGAKKATKKRRPAAKTKNATPIQD